MRCARPSTTAVLPTPGSPMRTGLFFVRLASTWTTRRISASRPMTGSTLPSRARAVRSTPYFSSAWNVPSGSALVTCWLPRSAISASVRVASVGAGTRPSSVALRHRRSTRVRAAGARSTGSCRRVRRRAAGRRRGPAAARPKACGAATVEPLARGQPRDGSLGLGAQAPRGRRRRPASSASGDPVGLVEQGAGARVPARAAGCRRGPRAAARRRWLPGYGW